MQKLFLKYNYVFFPFASLISRKAKKSQKNSGEVNNYGLNMLLALLLFCLLMFSNNVFAEDRVFEIDIPAQNAARSLEMLAEQTGAITLFPYDIATQVQANSVNGQYTLEQALNVLLKDSGLLAGLSNQRVITIKTMAVPPNKKEEKAMSEPVSKKSKILAVLSSILMSVSGNSNAHESEASGAHLLEEIIVTARKTEESLLTTPLSISVFDTQELNDFGMTAANDLADLTPGFQIENDLGRRLQRPVMRGVENSRPEAAQPVSIYVDGIYTRSGLYSSISESVERIEVLKGPQAALDGRSANGGVVNYITIRPEKERSGKLSLSIAEHNNIEIDTYFSGSITDNLSASIGLHHYEYGGEYKNKSTSVKGAREIGSEETNAIYAALYYKPNEHLEFVTRAYYSEDKDGQIAAQYQGCEPGLEECYSLAGPNRWEVPSLSSFDVATSLDADSLIATGENGESLFSQWDFRAGLDRTISRVATNAKYDFNNGTVFEWLAGYTKEEIRDATNRSYSSDLVFDSPINVGLDVFFSARDEKSDLEYFSNEFRLSGDFNSIDWMIGLFALQEERHSQTRSLLSESFSSFNTTSDKLIESSVFARVGLPLGDKLSVNLEGRVTYEDYQQSGFRDGGELDNSAFNPRLTLDYKWSENTFLYSSISSGEKLVGRGINYDLFQDLVFVFGEEVVDQFEVGVKKTMADGHMRLHAAAYWLQQQEKIAAFDSFSTNTDFRLIDRFRNFPSKTEIRGVEIDYEWLVNDHWNFAANYAFSDAEFSKASLFGFTPIDGFKRPRVPSHAFNAIAQYKFVLENQWVSKTGLIGIYNSSRVGDSGNSIETGDQLDFDLRTSIARDNLELSLWVENVLGDQTPSNAVKSNSFGYIEPGYISFLPRGRQAGVSLKYEF